MSGTPDGSTLVLGMNWDDCIGSATSGSDGTPFIAKLKPDGSPDRGFGSDGVGFYGNSINLNSMVKLMPLPGGKLILVNGYSVSRINSDGSLDESYGYGGVLVPVPLPQFQFNFAGSSQISAATLLSDGSVLLGGGSRDTGLALSLVDPSGHVDDSFGVHGLATFDQFGTYFQNLVDQVAVTPQGKIIFAGWAETTPDSGNTTKWQLYSIRLLADGSPDPTFGSGGGVSVSSIQGCFFGCPGMTFHGIRVSQAGQTEIYGGSTFGYPNECHSPVAITIDDQGSFSLRGTKFSFCPNLDLWDELPDGRFATSTFETDNKGSATSFGIGTTNLLEKGPFATFAAPGDYPRVADVIYDHVADQLIGVAQLAGPSGIAVVRVDPESEEPVTGFGKDGLAKIPGDQCRTAPGGPLVDPTPTKPSSCVIGKPVIGGSARVTSAGSRKPGLRFEVSLGRPPEMPRQLAQRVQVQFPAGVRPTKTRMKSHLFGHVHSSQKGKVATRLNGRILTLIFRPKQDESGNLNRSILATFGMRSGGLEALPRPVRNKRLKFEFTGSYEPGANSIYRSSRTSKTIRTASTKP